MKQNKLNLTFLIGMIPLIALLGATIYTGAQYLRGEVELLKVLKCLFGAIVVFIPLIIKPKATEIFFPAVHVVYYIFIFFSIFGGEVLGLYSRFTHFDSFLHVLSGGLIAAIGYQIGSNVIDGKKHPFYLAMFAFSFAMTIGIFWEIYEFTGDRLMDLNMQRYQGLTGWHALYDTMKDVLCNTAGATVITALLSIKKK